MRLQFLPPVSCMLCALQNATHACALWGRSRAFSKSHLWLCSWRSFVLEAQLLYCSLCHDTSFLGFFSLLHTDLTVSFDSEVLHCCPCGAPLYFLAALSSSRSGAYLSLSSVLVQSFAPWLPRVFWYVPFTLLSCVASFLVFSVFEYSVSSAFLLAYRSRS